MDRHQRRSPGLFGGTINKWMPAAGNQKLCSFRGMRTSVRYWMESHVRAGSDERRRRCKSKLCFEIFRNEKQNKGKTCRILFYKTLIPKREYILWKQVHTHALANVAKTSFFLFVCLFFWHFGQKCMYFVLLDAGVMNLLIRGTLKIPFVHSNLYLKYIPHLSLFASSQGSILLAGLASLV